MNTVCVRSSFPQVGTRDIILRTPSFTALFPAGNRKDDHFGYGPRGGVRTSLRVNPRRDSPTAE